MCIGNTTSPAANNTTNVRYGWGRSDDWETPEVIGPQVQDTGSKKQALKTPGKWSKSQSSRTSGGTY
jgi:hypothetical protein